MVAPHGGHLDARNASGRISLRAADETRRAHIDALKAADNHDFTALLVFARF
jgi:hypothetical protein